MGQILSQPVTEKTSEEGGDSFVAYGLSCMQGWRISMEDSHSTILNMNDSNTEEEQVAFFGVYDGHGGEKVALFTGEKLPGILKATKSYQSREYSQSLKDGFLACDVAILNDEELSKDPSGCAATCVIISKDEIYCGNAGDSRTIMSVNGQCKPLSFDHKPTNEGEKARIVAAGGYVDLGRVNGNLALSRGIGDFEFKQSPHLPAEEQVVTAYPDVMVHEATKDDEFIVLACDGIWDCLTSQQVVDFVRRGIKLKQSLTEICESMMDTCLAPSSGGSGIGCDNMSVCIVALLHGQTLEEWYAKIGDRVDDVDKLMSPDDLSMDLYKVNIESKFQHARDDEQPRGGSLGMRSRDEGDEDGGLESEFSGSPMLIQQLLAASNISTNNNIIYLDSSTSSILQSLGVMGGEAEAENDEDKDKMVEIEEEEK
ncbi:hypothetical protein KL905_003957 [Ogataea polymorpha]|nr:hypothetical protein KL937_003945 [Ogataea polymorpha]KAG7898558.1 hypothetical protein KL935_004157 [Ogataea polymorpha]KAG7907020.1 hypothetical protein KL906_004206 [Ogataea polymorpha]KAG7914672.1 hypothetical protein KL927_004341 [Ogataea polymorpha]KAG7918946.1 hypothetical protein KL905_003957 [Ogataea polymorpha]